MAKYDQGFLLSRYVWLVDTIYNAGRITFEEINSKWMKSSYNTDGADMPKKTFQRHLRAAEEIFGIEISCEKGGQYRYYIAYPEDVSGDGAKAWLLSALAVNNMIAESKQVKDRILYEKIPSGQDFLKDIVDAMTENRVLIITHKSFYRNESRTFSIEPWCVKVFHQRWYLLGKAESTRSRGPMPLTGSSPSTLPTDFSSFQRTLTLKSTFPCALAFSLSDSIKAQKVVIRANDMKRNYLRTLPWHRSQKETNIQDSYSDFEFFLKPTLDFKQEILCQGKDVEVLEPKWLRDDIRDEIARMGKLYED